MTLLGWHQVHQEAEGLPREGRCLEGDEALVQAIKLRAFSDDRRQPCEVRHQGGLLCLRRKVVVRQLQVVEGAVMT